MFHNSSFRCTNSIDEMQENQKCSKQNSVSQFKPDFSVHNGDTIAPSISFESWECALHKNIGGKRVEEKVLEHNE